MSEGISKIRCDTCGATYSVGTKTCRSCGKTLMTQHQQEDAETLHGMPLKDWHAFIEKNSNYYVDLFKRKQNKVIFASINIWAIIFGIAWFFYRKMYKTAAMMLALSVVLSLVFTSIGMLIGLPEMNKAMKEFESYSVYMTYTGEKTDAYPVDNEDLEKEILAAYSNYERITESISNRATLIAFGGDVVYGIILSFFSEYLYREHVMNNTIRKKGYVASSGKGGVSLASGLVIAIFGRTMLTYFEAFMAIIALFIMSSL